MTISFRALPEPNVCRRFVWEGPVVGETGEVRQKFYCSSDFLMFRRHGAGDKQRRQKSKDIRL
jgi:hypothetical protein